MSKAVDAILYELTREIERRLTLQAKNLDLVNKLAQERQNCAKYEARIAELEAMKPEFEAAELDHPEPEWTDPGEHAYDVDAFGNAITRF